MVKHTNVLGPGRRAAIWFQGCKRKCKGCMSPDTRALDGGQLVSVKRVFNELDSIKDIEGVTISGGEPFLQADGLYLLLKLIREKTDLSVIIYTGFTVEQLHAMKHNKIEEILNGLADIIIDGEYIDELNDGLSLRGSSNQKVIFITDRYNNKKFMYEQNRRDAEVIATKKDFFFIGIPTKEDLKKWNNIVTDFASNG